MFEDVFKEMPPHLERQRAAMRQAAASAATAARAAAASAAGASNPAKD